MFTSHLPRSHAFPIQYLYAGAGLALVVVLLAGVAYVARGQVEKAQLRESLLASQRLAAASCVETLGGRALNRCLIDARATQDFSPARTTLADGGGNFGRKPAPVDAQPGFMAASFSPAQR